jgi:hypothetical protein
LFDLAVRERLRRSRRTPASSAGTIVAAGWSRLIDLERIEIERGVAVMDLTRFVMRPVQQRIRDLKTRGGRPLLA